MDIRNSNNVEDIDMNQQTDSNSMNEASTQDSNSLVDSFSTLSLTYTQDSSIGQETSCSIFDQGKAKTFYENIRAKYGLESFSLANDNNGNGSRKSEKASQRSSKKKERKLGLIKTELKRKRKRKNKNKIQKLITSSSTNIDLNSVTWSQKRELSQNSYSVTSNCVRRRKTRRGKRRRKSRKNYFINDTQFDHEELGSTNTPDSDSDDAADKSRAYYRHLEIGNVSSLSSQTEDVNLNSTSNTINEHETL